jgi:hypothetical protein
VDSRTLDAVAAGLNKAAASPTNDLRASDVPAVQAVVASEVRKTEIHLANQEPFFQSRVTLGNLTGILASSGVLYAMVAARIYDPELLAPPVLAILGNVYSLYGRWMARKPIGA